MNGGVPLPRPPQTWLAMRLARIEERLDRLERHAGLDGADVRDHLRAAIEGADREPSDGGHQP